MKKISLIILLMALSFLTGFAFKTLLSEQHPEQRTNGKVTGIGGIFFKSKDPRRLREWYRTRLGLKTNDYGAVFEWRQGADTNRKGFTQWSPFKETTNYFAPSGKDFMINYRVEDMEALVKDLEHNGVTILDTIEAYDYGKFVHILDIEGNKIELWEPDDAVYEAMGRQMGAETTK